MSELVLTYSKLLLLLVLPVGLFGAGYFAHRQRWFLFWLLVFSGSVLGVVWAGSWFGFITAWEGVTIAILALLSLGSRRATIIYGLVQITGLVLLLIGFSRLVGQQGVEALWHLQGWEDNHWLVIGFALKAGLLGVHYWLPVVHTAAPSPVSALLSGYSVTLGVWGLLQTISGPSPLIMAWGIAQAIFGGIKALRERDIKKLLAYSTISHVGLMLFGVGAGSGVARVGVLVHVVGHGLFKDLLFLTAGYIESRHHIRDVYRLREIEQWPLLPGICLLLGALGLMGMPLFAGYAGKFLLTSAAGAPLWMQLSLKLISLVSAAYAVRLLILFFRGKSRQRIQDREFETFSFPSAGLMVLALATLVFGLHSGLGVNATGMRVAGMYSLSKIGPSLTMILLGGVLAWFLESKPLAANFGLSRIRSQAKDRIGGHGRALLNSVQQLHNGDITRYLQWFSVTTVVILLLFRLRAS